MTEGQATTQTVIAPAAPVVPAAPAQVVPAPASAATRPSFLERAGSLFTPLRFGPYRLAWTGRVISLFGDNFQLVALAAFALDLTQRTSGWGAVMMLQAIPRTLLMLAGGVLTDRFRPHTVILGAYVFQGMLAAALAGLAATGQLGMGHLYAYAGLSGVAVACLLPATMSVVPDVLPREEVRRGNALWSLAFNLAQFAAPPLAGMAIAAGGAAPAFAVNALTFAVAAALFVRIRLAPRPPRRSAARRDLAEGFRAARRDPIIWRCILLAPVYTLGSTGATVVGLPALAKLALEAGDAGVGLLYGALGAGAVVGAFFTGAVATLRRQALAGSVACFGVGVPLALAAGAPGAWAAVPLLALSGAFQTSVAVIFITLVQGRSPEAARGRVMSLYMMGVFGCAPFSFALAGAVGDLLGPRAIVALGGALVVLCGALCLASRPLREVE